MINESLYKKTVDILYQAYFNDTLVHGNCHACVIGNLVAANTSRKYCLVRGELRWSDDVELITDSWYRVFGTLFTGYRYMKLENYEGEARDQIEATGYHLIDLDKIECAFEKSNKGGTPEDYMFNGLVAVLEVLKQIHQVTDEDLITTNHKRFSDHYSSLVK